MPSSKQRCTVQLNWLKNQLIMLTDFPKLLLSELFLSRYNKQQPLVKTKKGAIMQRLFITIISILCSCDILAKSSYQVDLIVFAHPNQINEAALDIPLIPVTSNAILLKEDTDKSGKPYHLLPHSHSSLQDEYYQLSRK